jgi:hypothetical protein
MPNQRSFFKINPETRTVVQVSPTLSDGIVLSEGQARELAGNLMNAIEENHHIKLEPIPQDDLDISLQTIERLKREFGNA